MYEPSTGPLKTKKTDMKFFPQKLMVFGHIFGRGNWIVGTWEKGETE